MWEVVNDAGTSSAPAEAMVVRGSKTRPRVRIDSNSFREGGVAGAIWTVMVEAELLPRLRPSEAMLMRRSGGGSGLERRMGQR